MEIRLFHSFGQNLSTGFHLIYERPYINVSLASYLTLPPIASTLVHSAGPIMVDDNVDADVDTDDDDDGYDDDELQHILNDSEHLRLLLSLPGMSSSTMLTPSPLPSVTWSFVLFPMIP